MKSSHFVGLAHLVELFCKPMDGKEYKSLTHALIEIGFKPSGGRPYKDEIDIIWWQANRGLKNAVNVN